MQVQPTSIPADRLGKAICNGSPIVALDIFDTLLVRTIRPEHVKILACDRLAQAAGLPPNTGLALYGRRRQLERAFGIRSRVLRREMEFRHAEIATALYRGLYADGLIPHWLCREEFLRLALRVELGVERQVLRARPGIADAMAAARSGGQRLVLVSDFYLPGEVLAGLLAYCGITPALFELLLVSCDHNASKRTGRLFDVLLAAAHCAADEVAMFGDNRHSDVEMARARGLRATWVVDSEADAFYGSAAADVTRFERLRPHDRPMLKLVEWIYGAARRQELKSVRLPDPALAAMLEAYQDALAFEGPDRVMTKAEPAEMQLVVRQVAMGRIEAQLGAESAELDDPSSADSALEDCLAGLATRARVVPPGATLRPRTGLVRRVAARLRGGWR